MFQSKQGRRRQRRRRARPASDRIWAHVIDPAAFEGDIVGGEVKKVKNAGKIHGKSVLNFTFETLCHRGQAIPVDSSVLSVTNSRGQENVDEEGQVIKKKNNIGKVALGTALGAGLGPFLEEARALRWALAPDWPALSF